VNRLLRVASLTWSPIRRWRLGAVGGCLALLVAVTGCGSKYSGLSGKVTTNMTKRDYPAALAALEDVDGGPDYLLVLLERGLLLHYGGDFVASNEVFQEAEDLVEELYTKSLSNEALSLLSSDNVRPYDGATFERVMIHYYRALNYIALNAPPDALVEARKANQALAFYTADLDDPAYGDDPFLQLCTGLLYEWGGEWDDALVSYRNAEAAYVAAAERGGPEVPAVLTRSLVRTAERMGANDIAQRYAELYPIGDTLAPGPGEGEIVLLIEVGFVPRLVEERVDIPILKTDRQDASAVWVVSGNAYHRIGSSYRKTELAYILSIAYPVFTDVPPRTRAVTLELSGQSPELELCSDLDYNAHLNWEDRKSSVILRTIGRAFLKYLAKKQAEDKDEALGFIVDLLGSITESADVRSWRGLPHDIYALRMPLPEGTHDLTLSARDGRGKPVDAVTLNGVEVEAGEATWVTYRLFR